MTTSHRVLDGLTVDDVIHPHSVLDNPSDPPDNGDIEIEVRKATPESHRRSSHVGDCIFPEIPRTTDSSIFRSNLEIKTYSDITQELLANSEGKGCDLAGSCSEDGVSFSDDEMQIATDSTSATTIGSFSATSDTGEVVSGSHDSSLKLSASGSVQPVDFHHSQPVRVLMNGDAPNGQASNYNDTGIHERAFLGMPPGGTPSSSRRHLPSSIPAEGYVAGNPLHSSMTPAGDDVSPSNAHPILPLAGSSNVSKSFFGKGIRSALAIKVDNGLRLAYHWMFLQIPMFYFTRVTRIFKEVRLSTEDMTKKVIQALVKQEKQETQETQETQGQRLGTRAYFIDVDDPQVSCLKTLWENFVDSLIREWKTLNIVSVLLMSAIIGTLQINAAFSDPLVRMLVFTSLICALMSLIYGGIFIIRFSSMRRVHKAIAWAKEGESASTSIFWNVWVLLAMPAIWLSWSLILYVIGIMSFLWRAAFNGETVIKVSPRVELGVQIAISCILFLGLVYLALIISTLKRYGEQMDEAWKEMVLEDAPKYNTTFTDTPRARVRDILPIPLTPPFEEDIEVEPRRERPFIGKRSKLTEHLRRVQPTGLIFHQAIKVLKFTGSISQGSQMPQRLVNRGLNSDIWIGFIEHATLVWNTYSTIPGSEVNRQDHVLDAISIWNATSFHRFNFEALLCRVYPVHARPFFAVYLTDFNTHASSAGARFGPIPTGLQRVDIFEVPSNRQTSNFTVVSLFAAEHYLSSLTDYPETQTPSRSVSRIDGTEDSGSEPHSPRSSVVDLNIEFPTTSKPLASTTLSSQLEQPDRLDGRVNTRTGDEPEGDISVSVAQEVIPFSAMKNIPQRMKQQRTKRQRTKQSAIQSPDIVDDSTDLPITGLEGSRKRSAAVIPHPDLHRDRARNGYDYDQQSLNESSQDYLESMPQTAVTMNMDGTYERGHAGNGRVPDYYYDYMNRVRELISSRGDAGNSIPTHYGIPCSSALAYSWLPYPGMIYNHTSPSPQRPVLSSPMTMQGYRYPYFTEAPNSPYVNWQLPMPSLTADYTRASDLTRRSRSNPEFAEAGDFDAYGNPRSRRTKTSFSPKAAIVNLVKALMKRADPPIPDVQPHLREGGFVGHEGIFGDAPPLNSIG